MKKVFSIVGLFVGLAFIVVGSLSMSGALGGETSYPGNAPFSYDSGYATFGGDYYTYSVNNSAEAASAARTAANNIGDVADFLVLFFGLTSVLFGLMVMCAFGVVLSSCIKKATPPLVADTDNAIFDAESTESDAETTESESLEYV